MSCKKDDTLVDLPDGSISFDLPASSDVIEMPVSILADATTTLEIKAALTGNAANEDHHVTFAIDTTKISGYTAKYGPALVLPTSAYLFYKSIVTLPAGATKSEAAILNIGQQTKLTEYTTYVLPVVIKSVDGKIEGPATNRVIYYVFKTGKPLFVNRTGWTIAGFSSQNSATNAAGMLIDANNLATYWASSIQQSMPQWVSINFGKEVSFISLTYYLPTILVYPTQGGYPTSMRIETSMDGTTWVNKGVFAGNIVNKMQTIDVGQTTARYLRFTVLASAKYSNLYDAIFISGIMLTP
ncbi:BT_3987 domain-containing protein [Pedobacter africanus]|uniref:F5/8 type C domain-containing protein n=1 Tax=Pedobacter africanus TaxID=151894 RepID=A0A1W1ZAY2_9SPHI|nr:DUF1735 domain-containing protein [Pedobacter africanus]SMC45502.1 protein of unknown function [Pedobacter africanus]